MISTWTQSVCGWMLCLGPMLALAISGGCAVQRAAFMEHLENKTEIHAETAELRAEIHRLKLEQKQALHEQRLANERAALEQMRNCLPEMAPLVESELALPLRQKFEIGPPEVDLETARELLKQESEGQAERMAKWREAMKAWKERKDEHDRRENFRTDREKENFIQGKKHCGCSEALACGQCRCAPEHRGRCGCEEALRHGRCCCKHHCKDSCEEVTCEYAPLKKQPFTEKPPEMPREQLLVSDLPLKMNLRIRQNMGEGRISRVRTGREPLEDMPRENLKGPCDCPAKCTDRPDIPDVNPDPSAARALNAPPVVPSSDSAIVLPPILPAVPSSTAGMRQSLHPSTPLPSVPPESGEGQRKYSEAINRSEWVLPALEHQSPHHFRLDPRSSAPFQYPPVAAR